MTVIKILFLIGFASVLYFVLHTDDDRTVLDDVELIKSNDIEVHQKNSNKRFPDYDPRKRLKKTVAPEQDVVIQSDSDNIDGVIQNSEKELKDIQSKYSQVLDDPLAKKDLENQAKKIGIEYKKALLVKLKNGEL